MRMIRALGLLGLLTLAGCATVNGPTAQQQAQSAQVTRLEHQGQYAQAAQAYMQLATQNAGSGSYFRLRAAEDWRQEGDLNKVERALSGIDRRQLSATDRHRYDLLQAQLALNNGDTARALALTSAPVGQLSPALQQRTLELRAQALAAAGQPYQAARIRVRMDNQLQGLDQAQNERDIVQLLGRLGPGELKQRRDTLADGNPMQPWIDRALNQLGAGMSNSALDANQPVGTVMPGQPLGQGYHNPGKVALLLPLTGSLARAATLIREGFFTAYFNDSVGGAHRPQVKVYDSGGTPAQSLAAYQQAVQDGANQVIGPLTREDVAAVIGQNTLPVPVLALNHPDTDQVPPPGVNEFGLLPETEGASVADHMLAQGLKRAYLVVSTEDFAQRAGKAFTREFTSHGGEIAGQLSLDPQTINVGSQIQTIAPPPAPSKASTDKDIADAYNQRVAKLEDGSGIFLSMRPEQARLVMPQLRLAQLRQPVFATSHVYGGYDNPDADRDLDGVSFCDAPWLFDAQPGLPSRSSIANLLPATTGTGARLFAFGMDAWSLTPYLGFLRTHPGSYVPGATGQLVEDDFGRIQRVLTWARFRNGLAHPLSGSLDVGSPTDPTTANAAPAAVGN
ncbi:MULTISPECIES: penicillin-binding protein activator [Oleiagrimonas]|uniref:ABC transporter substrate-binding protein n=1 Tax=Oleiagrimonas citrea TaxID=1665687 RepID=A0A846ZMP4_9GAMM|nr:MULTISPECIES: penicillin-binding protein activator [Oleiagrimonas]NKZ39504.1 ABC transporter substrate-binding protein [Oleiagrimonas citrea]